MELIILIIIIVVAVSNSKKKMQQKAQQTGTAPSTAVPAARDQQAIDENVRQAFQPAHSVQNPYGSAQKRSKPVTNAGMQTTMMHADTDASATPLQVQRLQPERLEPVRLQAPRLTTAGAPEGECEEKPHAHRDRVVLPEVQTSIRTAASTRPRIAVNARTLREAIIAKEILDRPVAARSLRR